MNKKKARASMKKAKQRQQQNQRQQDKSETKQQQQLPLPVPELAAFSLAAAIQEAKTTPRSSATAIAGNNSNQPRKIFNISSHQSIDTTSSFVTATESLHNDTPAVSYFVDSSDEEQDQELTFGNDPLAVLSRSASTPDKTTDTENSETAPTTEIVFANENPEETIPEAPEDITPITSPVTMAKKTTKKTETPTTETTTTVVATTTEEDPHFDVAQHVYEHLKGFWGWGKTVPVVQNVLGLSEAVSEAITTKIIHKDLPALDQEVALPNLKKLDDQIVTPIILAVWKIVGPVVAKSDEMVVKPVMTEVVPRVLGPLGIGKKDEKKEVAGAKKIELKIKEQNPEYTSAPELN